MGFLKKLTDASKAAGSAAITGAKSAQKAASAANKVLGDANRAVAKASSDAAERSAAATHGSTLRKLSGPTQNFTKAMVVRTYTAKQSKLMEEEGSALISQGYQMQGQSGFAENKGVSWTSFKSANRSKGITTITFVKSR